MASSSGASEDESTFLVKDESGTQFAWLFNFEAVITSGMGGLFTERNNDFTGIHDILDLGCGSGGWLLSIARKNPDITVTGVDINEKIIEYVRTHARVQGIHNARFDVMNILKPLQFPDESFDLVNARTLFSSLYPHDWPALLLECKRVLRSGGVLRLTEMERTLSSSLASERFWDLYCQALSRSGRSFSVDGRHIGIVQQLGRLLHEAGFERIQNRMHTPDSSTWSPNFEKWRQHDAVARSLVAPFIISTGISTKEELDQINQEIEADVLSDSFSSLAFFFTAWGSKP